MVWEVRPRSMERRLRETGFDQSHYDPERKVWVVACSCCTALVIKGVPCHELRCWNFHKCKTGNGP